MSSCLGYALFCVLFFMTVTNASAQEAGSEEVYTLADTARARVLLEEVSALINQEKLEEADVKAIRLQEMCTAIYGPESRETAMALHKIGVVSLYKGNIEKGKEAWKESLRIRIKVLGPKHEEVAGSYNNLGSAAYFQGDLQQASEYFEKAIDILLVSPKADSLQMIDYLYNLAQVYSQMGNYDRSIEFHEKTLQLTIALLGDVHPNVAESYKSIGDILQATGDFKNALAYQNKALNLMVKIFGEESPQTSDILNSIAITYVSAGDYDEALPLFIKAVAYKKITTAEDKANTASYLNNIGSVYEIIGEYKKAIEYFMKALKMQADLPEQSAKDRHSTYNNMAVVYNKSGDSDRSLEYFEKALHYYLEKYGDEHPNVPILLNNIGLVYLQTGDYAQALESLERALAIRIKMLGESHTEVGNTYNGIGTYYDKIGDYEKAIECLKKGLEILLKAHGEDHPNVATFYNNIGVLLGKKGDWEEGAKYLNKSIAVSLKTQSPYHPALSGYYAKLGTNYQNQKKYTDADQAFQLGLYTLGYRGQQTLDSIAHIKELTDNLTLFAAFQRVLDQVEPSPMSLLLSQKTYRKALSALNRQSKSLSPASKSSLAAQSAEICAGAIATNQILHTLTDSLHYWLESFDYAERSKAYLLYESMKNVEALHIAGIPDNLLEQEYDLRVEIAYNDKKKQEKLTTGISDTDSTVLAISSKLFDLNRQHEALIQVFEKKYPDYYQAKYGLKTASLPDVQQSLTPNQTMLQYVVGDSSIFLFVVQKNHFEVQEIKKDFPLERWVDSMTRHGIYGYHTLPMAKRTSDMEAATVQNYTHTAQRLYEKLIAPVKSKLTPELIIIPDGVLGYIPFETLLSKTPGRKGVFSSYPFLLREHRISYCYSATLLREMRSKKHRNAPEKTVLALAPFYRGNVEILNARVDTTELFALRDSFNTLNASGEEVAIIAKLLNGTPIYGAAASLDTFRNLAAQHRILHLSTHGKADDRMGDYAYLALGASGSSKNFDKLYARDLYNLELNADLVVLSACETGLGKLRRGEGIVSLARAFAYAGAKSLVTSLWKVDDSKTKDLLVNFYKQLKAGKPKDEALQQAKLDFLNKNRSEGGTFLHPFFWAGFIAIGDMGPIK